MARPRLLYRPIRLICRATARLLFDVTVDGRENLPAGGSIVAGLPHRNWVEPLLLIAVMPATPRLAIIAEGRTVSRSWWRRQLVQLAGGVIPIDVRAEASSFERIARAVADVTNAAAAVAIFPETGPPSHPPEFRRLSPGVAHLAARSRAQVVPVVFGGTHELYLRRRIVVRILPALEPPDNTRRPVVAAFMADLQSKAEVAAVDLHRSAESRGPERKRWRWLTGHYPKGPPTRRYDR